MRSVARPRPRTVLTAGRLAALLAAAVFLLVLLPGSTMSVHLAMPDGHPAAGASPAGPPSVMTLREDLSTAPEAAAMPATHEGTGPVSVSSDAQHAQHLIGACLVVLAGGLIVIALIVRRLSARLLHVPRRVATRDAPARRAGWRPPPPTPPTLSPVLRT